MDNNNNPKKNNSQTEEREYIVSFSTFLKKLKKYFSLWIAAVILFGFISLGISVVSAYSTDTQIKAVVNFSFNGIEQGLDPNGQKFDANTIKNPAVVEMALNELGIDSSNAETIRNGITIEKVMPQNAYNKFTVYNNILNAGGENSVSSEKLLESSYYPTQFNVIFDYKETEFDDVEATDIINTVLDKYNDYFYKLYGYNELIDSSLSVTSYTDYDYIQALDMFQSSLDSIERYLKNLAIIDVNQFRSSVTGYTFDDLVETVKTIKSIDFDRIMSYAVANNVTKDKNETLVYYDYQINNLVRKRNQYSDQIKAYDESIEKYEKDQMLIVGNEEMNATATMPSEKYDELFTLKTNASSSLADTEQKIDLYQKRQQNLISGDSCTKENIENVETNLASLNNKLITLINDVEKTAEDYYKNEFSNAYNVITPASAPSSIRISLILENIITPFIVLEFSVLAIYLAASYFMALYTDLKPATESDEEENKKDKKTDIKKKEKK